MLLHSEDFQNSDTCHGRAFVAEGAPIDMTITMACTPPFSPDQYEIIKMKKEEVS